MFNNLLALRQLFILIKVSREKHALRVMKEATAYRNEYGVAYELCRKLPVTISTYGVASQKLVFIVYEKKLVPSTIFW